MAECEQGVKDMKLIKLIPMALYTVFCFLAISKDTVFDKAGHVQNEATSSDRAPSNGDGDDSTPPHQN